MHGWWLCHKAVASALSDIVVVGLAMRRCKVANFKAGHFEQERILWDVRRHRTTCVVLQHASATCHHALQGPAP
jgi:hypothetical protein